MARRTTREKALYERWGKRIKSARTATGLSQGQLADLVGATQSAVSEWEHGDRAPSDVFKFRLAEALHRTLDELFEWPERFAPEHEVAA